MFNLLFLLPQVMNVGQDIVKCLDGGMTEDEYKRLLNSLADLVEKIPALSGFMAIIQSVLKVARVAFPLIQEIKNIKPAADAGTLKMGAAKKEIDKVLTKDDLLRASRSLQLLTDLSSRVATKHGVTQDPKTKKTIDVAVFVDPTRGA